MEVMKRFPPVLCLCAVLAAAAFAWQQKTPVLPEPFATPSSRNNPKVIKRPEGAQLKLAKGFTAEEYLTDFKVPRVMLLGSHGEMLVSDSARNGEGCVWIYPDIAKSKDRRVLISKLDRPYGLAFWKDYVYVGEPMSIKRYKYDAKAMTAGAGEEIASLAGFDRGHWTRSLLFDRKGEKLYVGVGSQSNVDAGENPNRAAINRYNPDGSGHDLYATGTRNPIGLHWYPGTDTLWAAVQERDELGDDLVPDYFTHIQQGGFYGWPFAYAGAHEDPRRKGEKPELVAKTIAGDVLLPAHAAVLDFAFYSGKQFPQHYQGGAFLAFHGSWNRSKRLGYSVNFVPFKNGKPSGPIEEILGGWMLSPDSKEVWGRPVAILQFPDGSLLVSEDGGNKIWRISYKG
jgi:glucose/arabinose dehydrogenase